ncbi:AAA family ATPase [Streptomyces sp. NPDC021224]|uniref:AAA family ATPase n=1 Tax=unclassified Streptomyces TaxID=2593676 RepID=UPI0037B551D7
MLPPAESAAPREIVGRDGELARLSRLTEGVDGEGTKVLVLTGAPGAGKSTLVDWAVSRAESRGFRTLSARGSQGESELGLAGAHQLLRPLLSGVDALPRRQRGALRAAFGLGAASEDTAPDPLAFGLGVLTLLSDAAARQPLLLVVDDAQWLDVDTLDLLGFLARRLGGEPLVLLLAAREESVPARFEQEFPHLHAGPLERGVAARLLDMQPAPPQGRVRAQILENAAGNPLALIELSRAHAEGRAGDGAAVTLPLTRRLERLFAADLPGLSADTRRMLLLVAASGATRLSDVLRAAAGLDGLTALLPAERTGLVRIADGQVVPRHPLVLSAVYGAAGFAERRAAHLALADALAGEPDRRAWHLSAAAVEPDGEVADALAATAERSRGRGGHAAAAAALERAAALSPDPQERARRLLAAARSAMYAGHPQWVSELTARVADVAEDARVRAEASLWRGWALGVTLAHDEAVAVILPVAQAMAASAPALAMSALSTAATSAYNSGDIVHRDRFDRVRALADEDRSPVEAAWSHAALHPLTEYGQALPRLRRAQEALAGLTTESIGELSAVGATAWVLDETELSVQLLSEAMDRLRGKGSAGTNATVAQALALAHFDSGAWTAAQTAAEEALWMAKEAGAAHAAAGSMLLQATVLALRGHHEAGAVLARQAVHEVDLRKSRRLHIRHRYALALAATVSGDHDRAYGQLRGMFTADRRPLPVHYHSSVHHLGDLAAAAVRAGRTDDARSVLDSAGQFLGSELSPRVHAVLHRATALLSTPDDAEQHFDVAVSDPAAARWPFELALSRLDLGEWLRRRRRVAEARPQLRAALDTFLSLGALPWAERATAELRAAGEAAAPPSVIPPADLTPQELQIAELAAQGQTNRDIAAQLYLSPRTVGYHLHKIFPKLHITSRAQLRDALS